MGGNWANFRGHQRWLFQDYRCYNVFFHKKFNQRKISRKLYSDPNWLKWLITYFFTQTTSSRTQGAAVASRRVTNLKIICEGVVNQHTLARPKNSQQTSSSGLAFKRMFVYNPGNWWWVWRSLSSRTSTPPSDVLQCKKRLEVFPVPSRDVTYQTFSGQE